VISALPNYTELWELGQGAQGRVVLARSNENPETLVAIKYLADRLLSDSSQRAAFRHEAEVLSQLHHPNLARIHEYLETGGYAAIVMDAVDGVSLKEVLAREGPLTPESALVILKGSLLGLQAAHERNIVHRDYKPANVMVETDGNSKLVDFGLARLIGNRALGGTPGYMAPEQWLGEAVPATDVYAATCVFFECVTGRLPFRGINAIELAAQHTNAPLPLEAVPVELRGLISHGMAKLPSNRPPKAQDFANELETVAAGAYGQDWEGRGLIAMGAATAGLAMLFPMALAASTTGTSTLAGTSIAHGATVTTNGGLLSKVGGAKGASGIAVTTTALAIGAVLLWPSGPTVGGVAHGSYRASFTKPSVLLDQPYMPASASPYMEIRLTVAPSRVRPGTKIQATLAFHAKNPQGAKYLPDGTLRCFGEHAPASAGLIHSYNFSIGTKPPAPLKDGQGRFWFYRLHGSGDPGLPTGAGIFVTTTLTTVDDKQPYVLSECAYDSTWTNIENFILPDTDELPPGKYQVSPVAGPPQITSVGRNGKPLSVDEVGAKIEGTLPVVTILG